MTTTSYAFATKETPGWSALQRGQRDHLFSGTRHRRCRRSAAGGEALQLLAQLAVLILELPVHLGQLLQPPRRGARLAPADERRDQRRARDEPEEDHRAILYSPPSCQTGARPC